MHTDQAGLHDGICREPAEVVQLPSLVASICINQEAIAS
jgi:hypothetical protein